MRIHCYYLPADRAFWDELTKHLEPLRRLGLAQAWHEFMIVPGQDLGHEEAEQLNQADLILLLVSADLIASFGDPMLERVMERHRSGATRVIPILVRPCFLSVLPIGQIQPLPANGRPVASWSQPDDAWVEIVRALQGILLSQDGRRGPMCLILSVGTTAPDLMAQSLEAISRGLGQALASSDYGLLCRRQQGIEDVVVTAFTDTLARQGQASAQRLCHEEHVDRADAVILLGGAGDARLLCEEAWRAGKPVFPLADTGGAALDLYWQMLRGWRRRPVVGLSRMEFMAVSQPTATVVSALMRLLPKALAG